MGKLFGGKKVHADMVRAPSLPTIQEASESGSAVGRERVRPAPIRVTASERRLESGDLTGVNPINRDEKEGKKKKKFGSKKSSKQIQKRDTLDEHEAQLKKLFQEFDVDGSGALDRVELEGVFSALGYTQEEAVKFSEEFMVMADKDMSDSVNFDELREFIATVRLLRGQGKRGAAKEVMAEAQREFRDAEEEEQNAMRRKFKASTPMTRRGRRRSSTAMSSDSGRRGSWMNDFVQKLFGTDENARQKRVMDREKKHSIDRPFLIDPHSSFRTAWDILIMVLILWTSVVLPFRLAFVEDATFANQTIVNETQNASRTLIEIDFWFFADTVQDSLFLIDIILNFRTAYFDDGVLIVSLKKIGKKYLKGWFFIDLLSTIPLDYIVLLANSDQDLANLLTLPSLLRLLRLIRLVKLLRLMRFARLFRYFRRWEDRIRIRSGILRIVKLVFMVLMFAHWNACIQFLAAALGEFLEQSWVVRVNIVHAPPMEQWSWAMFNVLSHMLSIGYGREAPFYVYEVWLTAVSMLMGATFYAVFIGNISILLLSFDTSGSLFNEKMQLAEEYMNFRNLPSGLRRRLREYYKYKWNGKKAFDEQTILSGLSQSLRTDINIFICRDLIYSVPFFHSSDPGFVRSVVSLLTPTFYLPTDLIIREGELAYEMFFIREGDVEVFTGRGDVCTDLSKGSYFGEIALLLDCKRTASIRALTHAEIFCLERRNYKSLMAEYPDIQDAMNRIARIRLEKLEEHKAMRTGYRVTRNETHKFLGAALGMNNNAAHMQSMTPNSGVGGGYGMGMGYSSDAGMMMSGNDESKFESGRDRREGGGDEESEKETDEAPKRPNPTPPTKEEEMGIITKRGNGDVAGNVLRRSREEPLHYTSPGDRRRGGRHHEGDEEEEEQRRGEEGEEEIDEEEGVVVMPEELNGSRLKTEEKGFTSHAGRGKAWAHARSNGGGGNGGGSSPKVTIVSPSAVQRLRKEGAGSPRSPSSPARDGKKSESGRGSGGGGSGLKLVPPTSPPAAAGEHQQKSRANTLKSPPKRSSRGEEEGGEEERERGSGGGGRGEGEGSPSHPQELSPNTRNQAQYKSGTTFLPILQDALSTTLEGTPPPPSNRGGRRGHRRTIQMPSGIEEELLRVTSSTYDGADHPPPPLRT